VTLTAGLKAKIDEIRARAKRCENGVLEPVGVLTVRRTAHKPDSKGVVNITEIELDQGTLDFYGQCREDILYLCDLLTEGEKEMLG